MHIYTRDQLALAQEIALHLPIDHLIRELSGLGRTVSDKPLTQLKYFSNTMHVTDVLRILKHQNNLKFVGEHSRFRGMPRKPQNFVPW